MIVEISDLICVNELRLNDLFQRTYDINTLIYEKGKSYKFIRVNGSHWVCRDESVLETIGHYMSDETLKENFKSKEDIRDKNILDLLSK